MERSVVIIGAGQAAYQTVASLRQEGFGGKVTVISDESRPLYNRPPLSKAYMLGKMRPDELLFRPLSYYEEHQIELIVDRATAIDRDRKVVILASGSEASYDDLVIATGARNRALSVPGAELGGVLGLRTLEDADLIKERMATAKHAVVVGAGFIGLEFAAVAAKSGIIVHVIELAGRALMRAVSEEMAALVCATHKQAGVFLHFNSGIERITGEGGFVTSVEITGGDVIPADLVIVGIGAVPNDELAASAGLQTDGGILVDSLLLTSDPAISAIGDCARFASTRYACSMRFESVQNAADQGRFVAGRLMGKAGDFSAVPWFWTDQGDIKLQMVGLCSDADETVILDGPSPKSRTLLAFKAGELLSAECLNSPGDFMAARKLMEAGLSLSPTAARSDGFDFRAWAASSIKAHNAPPAQ